MILKTSRRNMEPCLSREVHGSLARAGKVKNQTPKVAKAEKKKARSFAKHHDDAEKKRGKRWLKMIITYNNGSSDIYRWQFERTFIYDIIYGDNPFHLMCCFLLQFFCCALPVIRSWRVVPRSASSTTDASWALEPESEQLVWMTCRV